MSVNSRLDKSAFVGEYHGLDRSRSCSLARMRVTCILMAGSLRNSAAPISELERPYRAPFYPVFPVVALVLGLACLVALVWLNIILSLIY